MRVACIPPPAVRVFGRSGDRGNGHKITEEMTMWTVRIFFTNGAVSEYEAVAPPGFYEPNIMTFQQADGHLRTFPLTLGIRQIEYWPVPAV